MRDRSKELAELIDLRSARDLEYDHVKVGDMEDLDIKAITGSAALSEKIGWMPLSVLACDESDNLWVQDWFYRKNIKAE